VHAYNSVKNDATGYSPHFVMFGWHPRLSVDAFLGIQPGNEGSKDHQSYVNKLQDRLQYSYKVAAEESQKNSEKNKEIYDREVKHSKLEIGDRVLVRKVGFKEKHKLADKWDRDVYVILKIPNLEILVYVVKREDGIGSTRTLHRNFLLPINCIPTNLNSSVSKQVKQNQKQKIAANISFHESSTSGSSDESENDG
jgi:hypothetical protein